MSSISAVRNTNLQQQWSLPDRSHSLQGVNFCNQDSVQQLMQRKSKYFKSKQKKKGTVYRQNTHDVCCANTNLDVADGVSLFVAMFAVGDHLLDLSTLKKVQLQLLRYLLTEMYSIQNAKQLPAH